MAPFGFARNMCETTVEQLTKIRAMTEHHHGRGARKHGHLEPRGVLEFP